ncbi:MAG: D-glycero-beta-D-manno-heptose 1-phosphate adenylyltransferase [Candidatus Omnitrophica bacterium]|nr:D-glycero-beta-D-manno-heptose 1-phosphate adenylyltransferase [Candidatus Omnitrophota bacterium]
MGSKLIKASRLSPLIKTLKKKNKEIAFTNGCFDLIHPGHIKLLKESKKHADILILGLNSDRSIRKIKGKKRPILNQKARIEILSGISYVDYIVVFRENTPLNLIRKIKPDVLIKGDDWKKDQIVGRTLVEKHRGKVIRIKLKKGYSTSKLIEKIKRI